MKKNVFCPEVTSQAYLHVISAAFDVEGMPEIVVQITSRHERLETNVNREMFG